jgi:hypothetical protein
MRIASRLLLALAAVAPLPELVGCSRMAWEKPGANAAVADADLEECRREARLQAFRLGMHRNSPVPDVTLDPRRPASTLQIPSTLPSRDAVVEQDWTLRCMRQKGYELNRAG